MRLYKDCVENKKGRGLNFSVILKTLEVKMVNYKRG